ncbi:MAG: nuclear transport factor 2 family protein [Xanthobacteraceae bacterium]
MPAAERRATRHAKRSLFQVLSLGALVAGVLVAVLTEPRAQPAPGEGGLVLAADTALGEAMRSGDRSTARRLLSLQFTYTDETGKIHSRKEFLGDLKSVASVPATGAKVTVYGLVAMVTELRKSEQDGDTFNLRIWAKQKGSWRALMLQDVGLAAADAPSTIPRPPELPQAVRELVKLYECKNPCETIPYRVRSPAEQDVITTYQAIERSMVAHDAGEYQKHFAEEYMYYGSGFPPVPKSGRIARVEDEKDKNIPTMLTAIHSMRLWVYGDSAVMVSENGVPDETEPLLRIARVWVKRNGQWQMAISAQTDVKAPQQH